MPLQLLNPGDRVRLNDEGVKVAGDFCQTRADAERMMGVLVVERVFPMEVAHDSGGRLIENFQSIDLVGWEALFDNTQMERVH